MPAAGQAPPEKKPAILPPIEVELLSRMTIDKQFHGDLEATTGQMLAAGTATQGSAGYVAVERSHRHLRAPTQRDDDAG